MQHTGMDILTAAVLRDTTTPVTFSSDPGCWEASLHFLSLRNL